MSEPADPATRRRRLAARVAPALAAVLAYLPNLDDFFVSDDFDHPFVHGYSWSELAAHLTEPSASGDFFRPLTRVSMGIDHALWGLDARPSHVVNVLLHAATAVAVGALARRLDGRAWVGGLAGVLFALHPIHPEAVSFLGARFDLMAGLFAALSMLAYVRAVEGGGARWVAASTGAFVLSVLSKEAGIFVPPALLAYELLCARERRLWRPLPGLAALLGYGAYRVLVIGATGGYESGLGASRHLPRLELAYLEQLLGFTGYGLITPVNQRALEGWATPAIGLLGALFLATLLTVALTRRRRWRLAVFLAIAIGLAALPASTLYSSWGLRQGLEGARFLYAASIPFCALLAVLLGELSPPGLRAGAIAATVSTYAALCVAHALVWSHASDLSLRAVDAMRARCGDLEGPEPTVLVYDAPDNYLGAFLFRNGIPAAVQVFRPDEAVGRFLRRELEPDFVESDGYDVRALAGRRDVCALVWDEAAEGLTDETALLRSAAAPQVAPGDVPGPRDWDAWTLYEAETTRADGDAWVIEAAGEDPQLEASVPLAVRALVVTMRVSPTGDAPDPLGEVFWAIDDVDYASAEGHHRLFAVHVDGEPHTYRLPVPLGYPRELSGARLRLRLDPTIFPARIVLEELALEVEPLGPADGR